MPPHELWLGVAGVRVGLRGNVDFESALGPRFMAYRTEPEKGALLLDVERSAAVKPTDAPSVVVGKDGVSVKFGSVDGKLARDGRSGRFRVRSVEDLPNALEVLFGHLLIDRDCILVQGFLVEHNARGQVVFGLGADKAVGRRPDGSRVRARGVVAVSENGGNVLADPTPFTGVSTGATPPEEGVGAGDDQSVTAVQPVGAPCGGLYRVDSFGPERFEPLAPREGLRILLEDVVFHDDDKQAAGHLLDVLLEVVAVVGVSRVIGKAVESFWLSVDKVTT